MVIIEREDIFGTVLRDGETVYRLEDGSIVAARNIKKLRKQVEYDLTDEEFMDMAGATKTEVFA